MAFAYTELFTRFPHYAALVDSSGRFQVVRRMPDGHLRIVDRQTSVVVHIVQDPLGAWVAYLWPGYADGDPAMRDLSYAIAETDISSAAQVLPIPLARYLQSGHMTEADVTAQILADLGEACRQVRLDVLLEPLTQRIPGLRAHHLTVDRRHMTGTWGDYHFSFTVTFGVARLAVGEEPDVLPLWVAEHECREGTEELTTATLVEATTYLASRMARAPFVYTFRYRGASPLYQDAEGTGESSAWKGVGFSPKEAFTHLQQRVQGLAQQGFLPAPINPMQDFSAEPLTRDTRHFPSTEPAFDVIAAPDVFPDI